MAKETEESIKRFHDKFNKAIKDISKFIIKLNEYKWSVKYESTANGREWDETMITLDMDDAIGSLALVLSTMIQWVNDDDETGNNDKDEQD